MSKVATKLQTMNLDSSTRTLKGEDEWTTIEKGKSARKPSKISFADNKPKTGGSAAASIYSQRGLASSGSYRKVEQSREANLMPVIGENASSPSAYPETHLGAPNANISSRRSGINSMNWRDPALRTPTFDEQNPVERRTYKPKWYRPGLVIRAKLHEEMFLGGESKMTADVAAKSITATSHGKIVTKDRIMLVAACFDNHYIAVPLFTHRGQGLQYKNPDEYISVRDHRAQSSNFQALSKHGKLTTEFMNKGVNLIDAKSTAHLTYHVSRRYDFPVVYEGYLTSNSVSQLIRLYNSYVAKE